MAGRGGRADALVPFDEALTRYEPVIGLETHVELGTATKMFCGCPARFGGEPNSLVCPVCLGLPGSLPVTNRAAIEYAIRIGLALNCTIAEWCRFARKNYFYPDMPKNFQISQYDEPLCTDGYLDVRLDGDGHGGPGAGGRQAEGGSTRTVRVGIEREAAVLDAGGRVIQETRHFHEDNETTTSGRSKEEAQDYRYFPEPDLVPVAPPRDWVEQIRASLPEAPAARRARLRAEWDMSALEMDAIVNAGALDLVVQTVAAGPS